MSNGWSRLTRKRCARLSANWKPSPPRACGSTAINGTAPPATWSLPSSFTRAPARLIHCCTRTSKLKGISTTEVRERQLEQLQPEELQSLRALCALARGRQVVSPSETEQQSLSYATAHVFERKSVVPEHELLSVALAHRPGEL